MTNTAEFKFKTGKDVFSPETLVALARPGAGAANEAGDMVLVPVSKYSAEHKENRKSFWVAPIESSVSPIELPGVKDEGPEDAFWIDTRDVALVLSGAQGEGQQLYVVTIKFDSTNASVSVSSSPVLVGSFPPSINAANFRYSFGQLVFSAYVYDDYDLTTVKKQDKEWEERGNTAYVYDETFVRHWDTWRGPKRSSLFAVGLVKDPDFKWGLGEEWVAVLKGTGHHVPVEPFGGLDDFQFLYGVIVYTAKDPNLPPAVHTKQNVYIKYLGSPDDDPRELTSGQQGATHSPVVSRDGNKIAWLELDKDGYESDRAKIVVYDHTQEIRYTLTQSWDRSPDSIAFSYDSSSIYCTAGDEAHVKIFALPLPPTPFENTTNPALPPGYTPIPLTHTHAASGLQPLSNNRLLYSRNSLTSPNDIFIIRNLPTHPSPFFENPQVASADMTSSLEYAQITKFTKESLQGMSLDAGESFWFEGALGKKVQGWALRPKGWKEGEKKKWPVLCLIHGGPQGAWEDQWSTRWNLNIFAQQGYFVIAINPTGSTTFGQEFTDAIAEDWGGKPFVDLQKGWKYALEKYPEIDPDRAAALGASWGGYAINWIQGHPEYGFGFKALICHDGVFDSSYNGFSTDELFFFNHDFGGRPWDNKTRKLTAKFSPSNFVHKWSTPQLLIHGSKDYRLPETESIGAFHALQQLGIPSRLVVFPDENHWVLKHGNSLKWHHEVFRWLDQFIGEKEKN
ncbi:alpha/beta-hydrolase [Rickenella mellea]|uniref:Dipeptidyl-peptidase V n=1 Tax=Rickenella mellea TaxID=50990 RepID=A0A4Y7PRT9_9AGAM|nr:alpha/beta-hydrolase [Rickenella mellea]